MKYHVTVAGFLINVFCLHLEVYSHNIFLKNSTIAHPETGLFFDYVGSYLPAETIIHTSAIFPMTTATCHFLPLSVAQNIRLCNITAKRTKRFIDIISLGVGAASLGMSVSNSMQISNLQEQVAVVESSLSKLSENVEVHGAHLAKLTAKHIEITEQLHVTQKALNDMIPILNSHADAINDLRTGLEQLHIRYQHSFLYLAITQICRDELTLSFLSPDDIHKLVYHVIEAGNLTLDSYPGSLPVVQIITKLLVRQQIDFVPHSKYMNGKFDHFRNIEEIGRLVITSYFAIPKRNQSPFYTYKLVTIPFFYQNETFELRHIPRYWAVNPIDNSTMEWYNPEASGCEFQMMTTCRDTPPIHHMLIHTCVDQILQRVSLTKCQTSLVPPANFFLRQLKDNFWITSSPASLQCVKIPRTGHLEEKSQSWSMNEETVLSPLSFVNVSEGYIIACPGFNLIGRPATRTTSSLIILNDNSVLTKNGSIVNVHQYITENMTLYKTDLNEHRKLLMDLILQTQSISSHRTSWPDHISSFRLLSSVWIVCAVIVLLYVVYKCRPNIAIMK